MIITCPQCAKKFNFKGDRIPSGDFKVRCSNCSHVWTIITPSSPPEKRVEPQSNPVVENQVEPQLPPPPRPTQPIREEFTPPAGPPPDEAPTFSKFIEEDPIEQKSFAQKMKLDWIVLFLGILIFLFIFMLDNFYQGSFFSNFTRDDYNYSVERKQAENVELVEEATQPEYKPKNVPAHMYSD